MKPCISVIFKGGCLHEDFVNFPMLRKIEKKVIQTPAIHKHTKLCAMCPILTMRVVVWLWTIAWFHLRFLYKLKISCVQVVGWVAGLVGEKCHFSAPSCSIRLSRFSARLKFQDRACVAILLG
jgi:hypothetical protein